MAQPWENDEVVSSSAPWENDEVVSKTAQPEPPSMSAKSVAQDVLSGTLQIVPTAIKGVADIARMATGDAVGTDTSNRMKSDIETIQKDYGSERAAVQKKNFEADMANPEVGIGSALWNNKGALADQILPTVGSMFLPVGVAGAAGKLATVGNAVRNMDKAAVTARVASAQMNAGIGAVAAQNAADTFSTLLEKGASMEDAYIGAGISVPFSVVAGKLTGGGAEMAVTRALTGSGVVKAGLKEFPKAAFKEGSQEIGEELGQISGEAYGTGEMPTLNSAGKRLAVAGTLGSVMGGGVNVATSFMPQAEEQPAPTPTPIDVLASPDLNTAIATATASVSKPIPVAGNGDTSVSGRISEAPINPEIAALTQEAESNDQSKLLADVVASLNPTGTLTVSGKNAAEAVRSLGAEIPFAKHADGSVLVSARFAEPVSLAIRQAQETTKPLEQTFTPMPIPATVTSSIEPGSIRPQTIAGKSAETYTDEQLAEITQSVTTNIDTRKGAAIELQARSAENQSEQVLDMVPVIEQQKPAPTKKSGLQQRDDLVGAIMRVTGNKGIAANMAQDITGDTANRVSKLRGLFTNDGTADLGDIAMLLREEEGFDVRDAEHLSELIRDASDGNMTYSMERNERDAAANAEKEYKNHINERATELGLKKVGGKRTLAVVEADIARVEQERDDMEAREERAAIQAESAASEAFVADDAPMSEDAFRKYFAQSASVEYTQEDIDRAIEYQTNRENDRTEAATGYAAEGETQGDSGQRNQDGETQEGARGTAEEGLTLTGETNAKESPPKYGIYQLADGSFAKFDRVWYRGEKTERAAMLSEMVIPGNASPKDRMGSQSWMFVKGFSRNEFDGSPLRLTKNGEDVAVSDESAPNLELTGETNEEAAANASRKIDPNALTKEEINAQSAGFGLQQQEGAPKPGPVQDGLRFSRVSDAPKGEELVAIHNLSADNVLHAASIGGIPVPSIGITKSASPFTGFGEITLIASNDMIDPDRSVPVFDRDAYTARFPTLNYKKVTAKKADDFYERMNVSRDLGDDGSSFMSQLWDAVKNDRIQSPDKLSRLFQTYTAPRMLYAKEVLGKEFKVPMRPIERSTFFGHEKSWRDFVKKNAELKRADDDAYNKAAAKAIKVAADEFLEREGRAELRSIYMEEIDRYSGNGVNWNYLDRAIKDATDFGKKRVDAPKLVESVDKVVKQNDPAYLKWISEQVSGLFQEPTITLRGREVSASLDNIVEAMTLGATSGAEKTMTFGVGKTSALLGKRFKSIEEIKQSRDQVVSNNMKNQIKSENEKLLEDYRMKAVEFYTGTDWRGKIDTFSGFDDAMEALTKAGKMALTDGNIRLALQSKKFRGVSNEVIELARKSIDAIRSASTEYFEAKPQRAVKLREFKGAVVPKGTDHEVIAALENSGLTIVQYNSKSEGDRAAKVEKLAKSLNRVNKNVLFSNSSNATPSNAITEAEATTAITSNLGNAAKVLIDAGQIVLVRTEEGLRNLAGAKFMTAWHGSPHDHDKFDSSKIGTGEGAQAYGYGLYFAGDKSVAEWYKNALAKPQIALDGEPLKFQSDDFANALRNILRQVKKGTSFYDAIDDEASILESSKMPSRMSDAQRLRGLKEGSVGEANAGKLYQVELAPKEHQYLDWDKSWEDQSDYVTNQLDSLGYDWGSPNDTGGNFYKRLAQEFGGDKEASDFLYEAAGIRGIRYLDGSSRNKPLKEIKAEFLAELPEDAEFDEVIDLVGTGQFSPKNEALIKALAENDWLGFDYPSQAISTALGNGLSNFDASPELLNAVSSAREGGTHNYVIFSDDDVSITAKFAKEQGAIQGATLPDGRIVLVLDNLTKDNIGGVLEHEGFHSSIRQLLGEKTYGQLMTRLGQLSKLNKSWAAQAEKSIPADTKPENWLEEIGAYAIEIYNRGEQLPGSIRKWVEDFLSAIRSAIISSKHMPERAKLMAMKHLKPQDLSRLAIAGLKAKANGIENVKYDLESGRFEPDVDAGFIERARASGVQGGKTTLERAAISRTILVSGGIPEGWGEGFKPVRSDGSQGFPTVLYSRAAVNQPSATLPEETKAEAAQRKVQDKFNRFTAVKDWLKSHGLTLSPLADVYRAEERYHGRVATRIEDFREKTINPIIQKVQAAGFTMVDVADFLEAQHTAEANAHIQKITGDATATAAGITDADAAAYLARAKPELESLANEFRDITNKTRDLLLKNGIITQEMSDAWEATYQHYVPLKGGQDEAAQRSSPGPGMSVNAKQKRRLGHGKRDEHVVENIMRDHERAIVATEKNLVGQYMLKMALEVSALDPDLITINQPEKRKVLMPGKASYVVEYNGSVIESFENRNDANRFVQTMGKSGMKVTKSVGDPHVQMMAAPMLQENEATVYLNGHAVRVQINDPILAQQYKNLGVEQLNAVLSAARGLNNWLSKAYTGYNPEFILVNMARDFTGGMINLTGNYGVGMASKALANYPKAFKEVLRYAITGNASADVQQYRDNGGSTGSAYLSDIERVGKDVEAAYNEYVGVVENAKQGNYWKATRAAGRQLILNGLLKWVNHLNAASENAMRVATFVAVRDKTGSVAEAASAAKNVTVNFNRKGESGSTIGALYLFANPNIQGTAALYKALFRGEYKSQAWTLVGGMMALAAMMAMQFDDDEWEKIPEYEKDRNLLIRVGDKRIKIPVPYGYGFFFGIGNVYKNISAGDSPMKVSTHLASSFFEHFSPLGNPIQSPITMLPTAIKIPMEPALNVNDFGRKIVPENQFNENKPDFLKMNRTTKGGAADAIARELNELSGGTKATAGRADVSPETLKYWWKTLTGGTGAFFTDVARFGGLTADGATPDLHEIPLIRKFASEGRISDSRSVYYQKVDEAKKAWDAFHTAQKERDQDGMDKLKGEKELFALAKASDRSRSAVKALRDRQDAILQDESKTLAERRLEVKLLERKEEELYQRVLNSVK